MNTTEQKDLLKLLNAGDILGAYDYVEAAGKPRKAKAATGTLKPLPRAKRLHLPGAAARMKKWVPPPAHLAVAPCGCTLYPDSALQCAACIEQRNPAPCHGLIVQHDAALAAFDESQGFTVPASRDFMICPNNGYYGTRDTHTVEAA